MPHKHVKVGAIPTPATIYIERCSYDIAGRKRVRRSLTYINGFTEDGFPVVGGCFDLIDGQGIPLSEVIGFFHNRGYRIDWVDLCVAAQEKNWNRRTLHMKIDTSLDDVVSEVEKREIMRRVEAVLNVVYA